MNIIFKVSLIVVGVLILLQIWISHATITQGGNLKKIENLERNLSEENMILKNEIATSSAIFRIASESASFGFSKPKNVQYIK